MVDRALGNTQFLTERLNGFSLLVSLDNLGLEFSGIENTIDI